MHATARPPQPVSPFGLPSLRCLWLALALALMPVVALANPKYAGFVLDVNAGKSLYADNADAKRYPASLTKIMTLYVVFEELAAGRLRLDTDMNVSSYAAARPPSKIGVRAGGTLEVRDAIKALVTKSANDASTVIAEHIEGSEKAFAARMTRTARRLGMRATTFRNPHGLPNGQQVTTARDMARLGVAIQRDFPQYYGVFQTRVFHYGKRRFGNHNRLLGTVRGVDGIKTGYIRASGFNLVTSIRRDGKHIVAVVMGGRSGASRNAHMKKLIARTLPKAKRGQPMPLMAWNDAVPPPLPHAKPLHGVLTARLRAVAAGADPISDALVAFADVAPRRGPSGELSRVAGADPVDRVTVAGVAASDVTSPAAGGAGGERATIDGPERVTATEPQRGVAPLLSDTQTGPAALGYAAANGPAASPAASPDGMSASGAIEAAIAVASIAMPVEAPSGEPSPMPGNPSATVPADERGDDRSVALAAHTPAAAQAQRSERLEGTAQDRQRTASLSPASHMGRPGVNAQDPAGIEPEGRHLRPASGAADIASLRPAPSAPPAAVQHSRFAAAFDAFSETAAATAALERDALAAAIHRLRLRPGETTIEMGSRRGVASADGALTGAPGLPSSPPASRTAPISLAASGEAAAPQPHAARTPLQTVAEARPDGLQRADNPSDDPAGQVAHRRPLEADGASGWQVQLGAVASEAQARELIDRALVINPALSQRRPLTMAVETGRGTLYRARLAGFPTRQAANAACKHFANHGRPCWAVSM